MKLVTAQCSYDDILMPIKRTSESQDVKSESNGITDENTL